MNESKVDKELLAINQILDALEPLDPGARKRVLDYTLTRLGVIGQVSRHEASPNTVSDMPFKTKEDRFPAGDTGKKIYDILSLKEEKQPKTAIQMAVLTAYYLEELAPDGDKKEFISSSDITKYFKQAKFKLPGGKAIYTLQNAKNAGYFDMGSNTGTYKLNPVGYNLAAYNLPAKTINKPIPKKNIRKNSRKKK